MGSVLTICSHSSSLLPSSSSSHLHHLLAGHIDMLAVNVLSKAYTNYNGYLTDNVTDTPVCK